jgi:hypothetical protein
MTRLRLTLRFRLYDLLVAVLIAALILPLAIRRQEYARVAVFSQGIARGAKTIPAAVLAYQGNAARAWADAVQYDWLIALLVIAPSSPWLLGSLGVFHRARLCAMAEQYEYLAPAPTRN